MIFAPVDRSADRISPPSGCCVRKKGHPNRVEEVESEDVVISILQRSIRVAVLIAIEIFVNIVLYFREDVIHVEIVIATALMVDG